jgi:predicted transposase YdaD
VGRLNEAQLDELLKKKEIKIAQKMLLKGLDPETIAEYLDLDIDTIHSLVNVPR